MDATEVIRLVEAICRLLHALLTFPRQLGRAGDDAQTTSQAGAGGELSTNFPATRAFPSALVRLLSCDRSIQSPGSVPAPIRPRPVWRARPAFACVAA